jgi:tetratricopeptide (TPR) repeat protein
MGRSGDAAGAAGVAGQPGGPPGTPPDDYDAVLRSGRRHRRLGDLDDAAGDFTRAAELRPGMARPLCERGAIRILQARYDDALADYRSAERVDPAYPGLRSYLAELFLYTAKPADALALSLEALEGEPDNLTHRINVGHARLLLGQRDEALRDYARVADAFHTGKKRYGADLVLADLGLMVNAGIEVPDLERVRSVLTTKLTTTQSRPPY